MQRLREARFGIDPTYLSVSRDQTHGRTSASVGGSATTRGVKELHVGVEEE